MLCLQSSAQGTYNYMAPEQFEENVRLTPQADVWAFACTFIHMLTGEAPMGKLRLQQIVTRVRMLLVSVFGMHLDCQSL